MTKFLIFGANAGNGNVEYHIRRIENPKPHQIGQALRVFDTYEDAKREKMRMTRENHLGTPNLEGREN